MKNYHDVELSEAMLAYIALEAAEIALRIAIDDLTCGELRDRLTDTVKRAVFEREVG